MQIASLFKALKGIQGLELSAVLLNKGKLLDELSSIGVAVTLFDEAHLTTRALFGALRAHVKRERPNILHSHRYKEHVLSAFAAKLSHNPYLVQTYHGLEENLSGIAALKMRVNMSLGYLAGRLCASRIIAVSDEIRATLQARFGGDLVCRIHNGIDVERVVPQASKDMVRQKLDIPATAHLIGAVGRLSPIKGLEFLIQALGRLVVERRETSHYLMLVGDGPLRSSLEQLAQEERVADHVRFLGMRTDVYDLLSSCDVFCLPSLHEGIPTVLLEAMALKVPLVASRVGGVPEVVTHGREGWLVESRDSKGLVEAIQALRSHPAQTEAMVGAARAKVESSFSIRYTARAVLHEYGTLIGTSEALAW